MPNLYRVRGRTVATAVTADHAAFGIWNPHATKRIRLREVAFVAAAAPGAGAGLILRRNTARGTAGSTATPTIEHDHNRDIAPPSGFLLDLAAYTVQPTLAAGAGLFGWILAAVAASGMIYAFPGDGLVIPAGQGLIFTNMAIIVPALDVTVVVED